METEYLVIENGMIQRRGIVQKRFVHHAGRMWLEAYVLKDGDQFLSDRGPRGHVLMADGTEREVYMFGYPGDIVTGYMLYLTVPESMMEPITRTVLEPIGGADQLMDVPPTILVFGS